MSTTTIDRLNAATDPDVLAIKAAGEKLGRDVKRLMVSASLVIDGKRLTVAEVDRQLAGSRLSVTERLTLKVGLERAEL